MYGDLVVVLVVVVLVVIAVVLVVVVVVVLVVVVLLGWFWEAASLQVVQLVDGKGNDFTDELEKNLLLTTIGEDSRDSLNNVGSEASVSIGSHGTLNGVTNSTNNFVGHTDSLGLGHVTNADEEEVGEFGDSLGKSVVEFGKTWHFHFAGWNEWNIAGVGLTLVSGDKGDFLGNFSWVERCGGWFATSAALADGVDSEKNGLFQEWAHSFADERGKGSDCRDKLQGRTDSLHEGAGDGLSGSMRVHDFLDFVSGEISDLVGILSTLL